jgi:hypothetical protein
MRVRAKGENERTTYPIWQEISGPLEGGGPVRHGVEGGFAFEDFISDLFELDLSVDGGSSDGLGD